jgi:hypothetical protein
LVATVTTTTVNTSTSNREGVQLSVDSQSNTVQIGNFVTDVTINPYIAPQIVSFYARGLRPNQRMHVFFDSILVDSYCAPGTYNGGDTSRWESVDRIADWGANLVTSSTGSLAGQFNVPSGRFKNGDRVFELADVENLAQGNAAITTQASGTFTASNISVTKQGSTLTTVNPILSTRAVSNTVISTNTQINSTTLGDIVNIDAQWEPIAQSLTINTPNSEAGVYATSLTIFFKQKAQIGTNGVTVYLCETNNGYPDGNKVLPFSTVHLPYASITESNDASVGTTFTFESPVFLNNASTYAFIVKPDNNDPDYWVYSAELGDFDIKSGLQMFSQPIIGTAFYGATTTQWSALQTEYIKFQLNVANFTSSTGDAYFNNGNTEYLTVYNVGYVNTSATILQGDYVFESNTSLVASVNTSVKGVARYYDSGKNILYVSNSSGNYTANKFVQIHRFANSALVTSPGPNTSTLIAYANTGPFYLPIVDAFVPNFAVIAPAGTKVSYDYKGTSNSYVVDTAPNYLNAGTETEFVDKERILVSRTYENAYLSGAKSSNIHVGMTSDSILLSPLIDTVMASGTVIGNQIDSVQDVYNEYYSSGSSKSKYVSQIITLANGQDAQDLQISITARRPADTDIKVYVKFLNGQDSVPISAKTWTPMLNNGYDVYTDGSNSGDFKEFVYTTYPYYGMKAVTGSVNAANNTNTVSGYFTTFGTDVKVGMWVNMMANSTYNETSRQVVNVISTSSIQLNAPFSAEQGYASQPMYIVPPPTTAWASANSITQLAAPNGMFQNTSTGAAIATVTANTTSNIITGSNTNFTILLPGQIMSIGGFNQAIVSVSNSTQLTVGTPWSANYTAANGYILAKNGLTYLNSNNSLYTTFKQFQIKVILQSNNSSQVPILHDLTALALQL